MRSRLTTRSRRGFSLLEVLVTIGVIVLVGAGAATIFNSISDTVTSGRRIAEINRFAARLERIMREDFESMSRDGFLVIVHQHAPGDGANGGVVPLNASEPIQAARRRRVDEIMFFARGDFETSRRSVFPGITARADTAAVYYGHGQKRRPDLFGNTDDPDNLFFNPSVSDSNIDADARLGVVPTSGAINPNRYASEWSLLRHVTLIADPQTTGQDLPFAVFGVERVGPDRDWLEDSDRQIGLQPAARSIFSSLGYSGLQVGLDPGDPAYVLPRWFREYNSGAVQAPPALRSSGIVDVATTSLAEIKAVVNGLSADREPIAYWNPLTIENPALSAAALPSATHDDFQAQFWRDHSSDVDDLRPSKEQELRLTDPTGDHVRFARKWMINALPSVWDQSNSYPNPPFQLSRMRYEDIPPRILFGENAFADNDEGDRARVYAQSDQETLGSTVFVPMCTEFIVEWSYGHINPVITDPSDPRYKQILWFGLDRWADTNGDGVIETFAGNALDDETEDHKVARPYFQRPNGGDSSVDRGPERELINGRPPVFGGFGSVPEPEIATFGYSDSQGNTWDWPRFIRVTMSLVDPDDPDVEQEFQMVFEIPGASTN